VRYGRVGRGMMQEKERCRGNRFDMNAQIREQERGGHMKGKGGARRDLGSDHDHLPVWRGDMHGRGSSRSRRRTLH
jgi:hypothetical protein